MSIADNSSSATAVLKSSTLLIAQARNAVSRCVGQLNATGQTLFALYTELSATIDWYIESLSRKLPQPLAAPIPAGAAGGVETLYPVSEETAVATVEAICLTINTTGLLYLLSGCTPWPLISIARCGLLHRAQSIVRICYLNWPKASRRSLKMRTSSMSPLTNPLTES
jgi:hypothetical protein